MPQLIVKSGRFAGQEFVFDKEVIIGRSKDADVPIQEPNISRQHARLSPSPDGWILSDLGSANGTHIGGDRLVGPIMLKNGTMFQFATVDIEFRESAPQAAVQFNDDQADVLKAVGADDDSAILATGTGSVEEIDAMKRRLLLINEVARAIGGTLSEDALLDQILDKIFDTFPQLDRGTMLLLDEQTGELVPRISRDRRGRTEEVAVSRTLINDVVENRRAILSADAVKDDRFSPSATMMALGLKSVICAPVIARDKVLGVIHLDTSEATRPLMPDDLTAVLGIASQAGLAIANARTHSKLVSQELVKQDLALAQKIQVRFLPKHPPQIAGWKFWHEYEAAFEVGGDYFGYATLDDGRPIVVIGDVSGKGVSGALYMARISSDVRYEAAVATSPQVVVRRVNEALTRDIEEGMFVTLVAIAIDTATGELEVINAGHSAPLVRQSNGEIVELEIPQNMPLGVDPDTEFESFKCFLDPGETVVLYTDGVTEAMNSRKEEFGKERLFEAMSGAEGDASAVGERIETDVRAFLEELPQNDDLTLVCFSRGSDQVMHVPTTGTVEMAKP
jgi:serine phosphatase RsbU (regulator of sigma subunit)